MNPFNERKSPSAICQERLQIEICRISMKYEEMMPSKCQQAHNKCRGFGGESAQAPQRKGEGLQWMTCAGPACCTLTRVPSWSVTVEDWSPCTATLVPSLCTTVCLPPASVNTTVPSSRVVFRLNRAENESQHSIMHQKTHRPSGNRTTLVLSANTSISTPLGSHTVADPSCASFTRTPSGRITALHLFRCFAQRNPS